MIEKIGEAAMYELLAEECTELAHAALKMARIIRDENPTSKTEDEALSDLEEEATDVDVCLKELALWPVEYVRTLKMARFADRWERRTNGKR